MIDLSYLRLGKLPVITDSRTFQFERLIDVDRLDQLGIAQLTHPDWSWLSRAHTSWGMLGNNRLQNCVFAAQGHAETLWTAVRGAAWGPSEEQVVQEYSRTTRYNPADPSSDRGTLLLNGLNNWRVNGMAGRKILAYLSIPPLAHRRIMQAIWLFGLVVVGVNLPRSAGQQMIGGQPWSVVQGPGSEYGSWGGHCVIYGSYTPQMAGCVTWDHTQDIQWDFHDRYVDEVYAVISRDWTGPDNRAPNLIKWAALQQAFRAL